MFQLEPVQQALRDAGLDGWLMYDFRGNNPLARRILDLDGKKPGSRRFFYLIPADGEPIKLVHRIESGALDHLPGEKRVYLPWVELEASVLKLLQGRTRLAMELFAPERQPVHLPSGCRNGRAGPGLTGSRWCLRATSIQPV